MFIMIGEKEYELKTSLGVGKKIESKFKVPIAQLFDKLGDAETDELVNILAIASGNEQGEEIKSKIYDEWDYSDLYNAVQEFVARLMYGGSPEQNEAKITKSQLTEYQKNAMRGLLGIPIPKAPEVGLTGNE